MKSLSIVSALTLGLTFGMPAVVLSHVGHGDEFQATGGIDRVEVKAETDQMLGIVVTPIEATEGSSAVMIPATALVDADGKQLVFVQYENFYEPVEVTTGETQGEMIEITQGLSVGEQLVTQGGLSLYAESRKTKTAEDSATETTEEVATTSPDETATESETSPEEVAEASPEEASNEVTSQSSGFPIGPVAAIGGGVVVVGAIATLMARKK